MLDVDARVPGPVATLAGYYLMGPGFGRIAERFCRAAIAIKENWPKPPRRVVRVLLRKWRGGAAGWSPELEGAIKRHRRLHLRVPRGPRAATISPARGSSRCSSTAAARKATSSTTGRCAIRSSRCSSPATRRRATSLSWIHYLLRQHTAARAASCAPRSSTCSASAYRRAARSRSPRLYRAGRQRVAASVFADSLALARGARGRHARRVYIPAGATIYVSLYATHRLAQFWPDPERFDPERFAPKQVERRPRFAFIPFAAGHRNCVGGTAAIAELKLASRCSRSATSSTLAPGHRVEAAAGTTMHPRYGMNMLAHAV